MEKKEQLTKKFKTTEILKTMQNEIVSLDSKFLSCDLELLPKECLGISISNFFIAQDGELDQLIGMAYGPDSLNSGGTNIAKTAVVAVMSISGPIYHRKSFISKIYGVVTCEDIEEQFNLLMSDERVKTVILDINSPGGTVFGIPELAEKIFNARNSKKIISIANAYAASAAYWLGSAASEFYSIPSGSVGSIGVYLMHSNLSEYYKKEGIEISFVKAGKKKTNGNPYEPLSEEARKDLQKEVDIIYTNFISAVAKHRNVTEDSVNEGFAEGGMALAKIALSENMIDGIINLDELILREAKANSSSLKGQASINNLRNFLKIKE